MSRDVVRAEPAPRGMADVVALPSSPANGSGWTLSRRWVTDDAQVWSDSDEGSRRLTVLDDGDKVQVTGVVHGDLGADLLPQTLAWVNKKHLTRSKPTSAHRRSRAASRGVSGGPARTARPSRAVCRPNTIKVYRSVCAAFPAVSSWGGRSGSGDHGAGLALDIMCTGSARPTRSPATCAPHRRQSSASARSSGRSTSGPCSAAARGGGRCPTAARHTAIHYDHVHVSVY